MAWTDLLRKLGIGDDEEDELMSRSSESKAKIARDAIEEQAAGESMGMMDAGKKFMRRGVGGEASPINRRDAENESIDKRNSAIEKRRAISIIKAADRNVSDEDAEKVLERLGGVRNFFNKRRVAEEGDAMTKDTIRELIRAARAGEEELDAY